VQCNFASERRKFTKRRHRNGHVVTDTAGIHNRLIRMTRYQSSAQVGNHAESILALEARAGHSIFTAVTCLLTMKIRALLDSRSAGNMKNPGFVRLYASLVPGIFSPSMNVTSSFRP
jgi:hypothetical protein